MFDLSKMSKEQLAELIDQIVEKLDSDSSDLPIPGFNDLSHKEKVKALCPEATIATRRQLEQMFPGYSEMIVARATDE